MSPKFLNFEIIFVYFLLLIPRQPTDIIKQLCSKDSSRLVRKIVRSKWTPILDKYQVKLPLQCPLHPLRDVFEPRQDAKKRDRPTQWTCRLCGKSFYKEKYVDIHFESRHKNVLNEAEDAVCLADFCDLMRCEVFQSEEDNLNGGESHIVTDVEVWGESFGQSSALAKANAAYLSLIPLRSSKASVAKSSKSHNRQCCQDKFSQSKVKDINKEPSKNKFKASKPNSDKLSNILTESLIKKTAALNTKGPENNVESKIEVQSNQSIGNNNKTQNEDFSNVQKVRASCRTEDLLKLKVKCERLIRNCISGLLLEMTNQAFKEMEDEMNKAVCWYLSCDRYWEDGPLEPRAFPWGLILILIMVLSLGICFCYYIIWILFDSEESTINVSNIPCGSQHYQQQQQHQYQYPQRYDYRHSPRRYITSQQQALSAPPPPLQGVPTHQVDHHLHQQQQHQQDILDRPDYTNRLVVSSSLGGTGSDALGSASSATIMDCDNNAAKMYSTSHHIDQQHYQSSSSLLRPSISSQDIIHNDLGHNEHYIYVTYPPDLKKRLFEKYE